MLAPLAPVFLVLPTFVAPPNPAAPRSQGTGAEVTESTGAIDELLEAVDRWTRATSGAGERAAADADARITAAVLHLTEADVAIDVADWRRAADALSRAERYADAATVARVGAAQHEHAADLHDLVGLMEHFQARLAESARPRRTHLESALAAFTTARDLDPTSANAAAYLYLELAMLGRFDEALVEFDRVHASVDSHPTGHLERGRLLLGAGRAREALGAFTAQRAQLAADPRSGDDDAQRTLEFLTVRATALAGEREAAVRLARAFRERERSEFSLSLLVDALAYAGDTQDALALLNDTQVPGADQDPAVEKSRRCAALLIALDGERPDDLRERLTGPIDHHILLAGAGPGGTDIDLASSPLCMAYLTGQVPWNTASWANRVMFALCVEDAPDYEPAEPDGDSPLSEARITESMLQGGVRATILGEDALQRAREALRTDMVEGGVAFPLTVERLFD